jgi:hypothetical protein
MNFLINFSTKNSSMHMIRSWLAIFYWSSCLWWGYCVFYFICKFFLFFSLCLLCHIWVFSPFFFPFHVIRVSITSIFFWSFSFFVSYVSLCHYKHFLFYILFNFSKCLFCHCVIASKFVFSLLVTTSL